MVIEGVRSAIDAGRFPVKRTVGEKVVVEADAERLIRLFTLEKALNEFLYEIDTDPSGSLCRSRVFSDCSGSRKRASTQYAC